MPAPAPPVNIKVERWSGEPFGADMPTFPGAYGTPLVTYNLRFPGQQYEANTGMHYNWMRDYEPWTGRYLQADPIGLAGGWSRYGYVGGNPLGGIDIEGLREVGPCETNGLIEAARVQSLPQAFNNHRGANASGTSGRFDFNYSEYRGSYFNTF
jgi:RHS repeat-associated protein